MFWKSFHGCGLDMFLCSCFPNKPTFFQSTSGSHLAHKHSHCFKASTFWVSPPTFFMTWREDHYLEAPCAHQAQQKLRNLRSSTAWLVGIGFCVAFLTPIPIISLILIFRVIGNLSAMRALGIHILPHKFDWTNPAHLHCSHTMALQVYAPYPRIYDEIFQRTLWSPRNDPAIDTLRVWIGCVATTHSQAHEEPSLYPNLLAHT